MNTKIKSYAAITKQYSTTFYWSTKLFPKQTRDDVYALYAFLRTCDDYADSTHNIRALQKVKNDIFLFQNNAQAQRKTNDQVSTYASLYISLHNKYAFHNNWIAAFFASLEKDVSPKHTYKTYDELCEYIYGVADVVGLMMATMMGLPLKSHKAAQALGRAMQLINIVRDIREDIMLGRVYIPEMDMKKFHIPDITAHSGRNKIRFNKLIRFEIARAQKIIHHITPDIHKIPLQYRRPILISANMYMHLAKKISRNPQNIWAKKIKVSKATLIFTIIKVYLSER